MLTDWSMLGFLLPPIVVPVIVALVVHYLTRRLWSRLGIYRWFWHPNLVDIAFFALWFWVVMAVWPGQAPAPF
ncbi:DUF1656 domain-containing protein [Larsenimonas suaedae]|uniref:DUF1656 domain-containing protein n=1 Tax=Larsenimonas suaedae TaxID=1851019 RepID=A0ABU1GTX0_9GAMM|nr:DUF1656 domain-containing protein [Larsenimonas suaedae]MCM2972351.1 DUF1656 domain-containing protein [Larsenimonas suaedae]MDR5894853.1 DUF1656 domain-containing protein [Larsenimonas suaedae]